MRRRPSAPDDLGSLQASGSESDHLGGFVTCHGLSAFVLPVQLCLGNTLALPFQRRVVLEGLIAC
jgi:hypothetical protein